jgi:tetratricopeptide (TPR) repeat protein
MEFDSHRNRISACGDACYLKGMRSLLEDDTGLTWDRLFEVELRSVFDEEIRRGVLDMGKFYTQSWGVVYFYLHHRDADSGAFFTKIIKGMSTGRSRPREIARDFMKRLADFSAFMAEEHEKVSLLYKAAAALKAQADYAKALEKLLELMERDPGNTAALRLAGETAFDGRLFEHALQFWQLLHDLDPKHPDYPWRVCRCLVETGLETHEEKRIREGVTVGLRAVKQTKSLDPHSLAALAMAYHAAGDCKKALATMRKATRLPCPARDRYKSLEKQYSKEIIEAIKKGG